MSDPFPHYFFFRLSVFLMKPPESQFEFEFEYHGFSHDETWSAFRDAFYANVNDPLPSITQFKDFILSQPKVRVEQERVRVFGRGRAIEWWGVDHSPFNQQAHDLFRSAGFAYDRISEDPPWDCYAQGGTYFAVVPDGTIFGPAPNFPAFGAPVGYNPFGGWKGGLKCVD